MSILRKGLGWAFPLFLLGGAISGAELSEDVKDKPFRLWASSDSHVYGDLERRNHMGRWNITPRESLGEAIRQSEGFNNDGAPFFDWDIGVLLGDFSGSHGTAPPDDEGREVVRQFHSLRLHKREDIYTLIGNTDASPGQWWARKWVDPMGENTRHSGVDRNRMPYPVKGTWERYSFRVGNILVLMMSDRNDLEPPIGKGSNRGGYPAGAIAGETFEWWKDMVEANQESIIITAHHHMLRDTTVASGRWEGFGVTSEEEYVAQWNRLYPGVPLNERPPMHPDDLGYHGYFSDGAPEAASYLYFIGDKANAGLFGSYLEEHPGAIDIWLGAHTHAVPGDTFGGRSHVERKWGVTFINVAALVANLARQYPPNSRLLTFVPQSREVRVQFYLHDDYLAPRGWYMPLEATVMVGKPFRW